MTLTTAEGAGLLIADGSLGASCTLKSTTINGGISVTVVEQVFLNTENRIVEALYTFPVPKNASVSNFSMLIAAMSLETSNTMIQRDFVIAYQVQRPFTGVDILASKSTRDDGYLQIILTAGDFTRFDSSVYGKLVESRSLRTGLIQRRSQISIRTAC